MPKFKDTTGREWLVEVNVTTLKRVRSLCDVDLLGTVTGNVLERLHSDPVLLVDVIYAICKPEADRLGVSDEDFGRAMAGDAIDHATKALLDSIVAFSPSPKDRANLGRVIQATETAMNRLRDETTRRIADGELERVIEKVVANVAEMGMPGDSSTTAPASSE